MKKFLFTLLAFFVLFLNEGLAENPIGGGPVGGGGAGGAAVPETDPIVGAVTGLVEADGGGNISAATPGVDYLLPNGSGAALTGIPLDSDFGSNGIMERTGAGVYGIATEGTDYYGPGGTDVLVTDGGTGVTSPTDHCVIVGSGAAAMTVLGVGAAKEVLKGVTGADPDFVTERDFSKQAYTADGNISEAQVVANKYLCNQGDADEADLVLPALSYAVGVIFIIEEVQNIEINPPAGEAFDLDGVTLDADDCVDSDSTVGSKIAATRHQIADASWVWSLDTIRGAWADTGASD